MLLLKKLLTKILVMLKTLNTNLSSVTTTANSAAQPYKSGNTITTSSNYPILCTGYTTSSNATLRFFIPLSRPIASNVSTVTITGGVLNVRQNGNYLIGTTSGGTQAITAYTRTIQFINESGIVVDITRPSSSPQNGWVQSASNNYPLVVSLYGATINFQ